MRNWERKKLGEVCIVERGSSPRPIEKYQTNSPDGVNWIKIGDTKGVDKYIFSTKEKITKEGAEKSRYVKEGDFILSNSMSFGKPYIMKTDGYIHDGWFVFRLPDYLDKDYFYYLLTSPSVQEQIQSLGAGAIVKNISGDLVKKVDITYPKSLLEQQRIVSILNECFAAKDKAKTNAEQNLKNAKELFESYLQGVFEKKGDGWEERKLGEVVKYDKNQSIHKGLPYVGLEHIESNSGRFIGSVESQEVKSSTFYFDEHHVLYGRLRPYLNKVLLPDFKGHCSTEIFPIKVNRQVAREFLFYWLIAGSTVKKIDATWTGARMPRANMNQVLEFDFAFPSFNEQQTIVRQLDALRAETQKLEAVYQNKIDDLEELKKSVLQKAFAGELKTEKELLV
jgi:type I restriction enzyme S subunit